MAAIKRHKTAYPGVFYRMAERIGGKGQERVYYIVFKRDGKVVEAKAGRQFADDMTEARAARMRAEMIEGKRKTRQEKRREDAARVPLKKLWEQYRDELINPATRATDASNYKHLAPTIANKTPAEIVTKDVDAIKKTLTKAGKSPQTIKHVIGLLRRIIRYGVKKGLCPMPDPSTLHFDFPQVDNAKTETLDAEQLEKFLNALNEYWDQPTANIFRFILTTGVRRNAALSLKWADVDTVNNMITLRGDSAKKGRTETIPINSTARAILDKMPRRGDYIFADDKGRKRNIIPVEVYQYIREKEALPAGFRPAHGLRHVFASHLASSGQVTMYELQRLLTHESPEMTQRYAHLHDEAMRRAAEVAAKVVKIR